MRILLISGIYPPDIGGPATFIPKLANYAVSRGNQVTVISLRTSAERKRFIKIRDKHTEILIKRNQSRVVRTLLLIYFIARETNYSDVTLLNGLFYEHRFSSIFVRKPYIYKIVGDPVWEKYRNSVDQELSVEEFQRKKLPLKYAVLRAILNSGTRKASTIIVPGKGLQEIVRNWTENQNVIQVNNGVPSKLISNVPISHDVVTVSRLVNWKNIDLLIAACSAAGLSLLVIGDGPERKNLEQLASNLRASVEFLGEQKQEDISELLNRAEIFALISTYEGMSFSLLEAMMQQRKILVSKITGNSQVISDNLNGVVLDDLNVEEIASELLELKSPTKSHLKNSARETALASYSIEKILDIYMQKFAESINA
jgi:glycosyltransferase involved in cell wall biosynthesis